MSSSRVAGCLLLFAAAIPGAVWVILLFVGTPSGFSTWHAAADAAKSVFATENPHRWQFILLAGLGLSLLALAIAYISTAKPIRPIAIGLFVLNIILLAISVLWGPNHLAFFVALPAWWGWKCIGDASMLKHQS